MARTAAWGTVLHAHVFFLLFLFAHGTAVHANTEIENVGPLLCERAPPSRAPPPSWPVVAASTASHRIGITPDTEGAVVVLHTDYEHVDAAASAPARRGGVWGRLLQSLPASARWFLTERYQLRLSWPANCAANVTMAVHRPEEVLGGRGGRPGAPRFPCERLLARVSATSSATPLRESPAFSSNPAVAHAQRIAEHLLAWVLPRPAAYCETIPTDLVFERLYFGALPSSTLWMLILVAIVLFISISVLPQMIERVGEGEVNAGADASDDEGVAEEREKDE
ncbi:hypothetical protein MSPP1_003512 [Malassezia sp. CBS 17886]|nr:hypothetical protein MSPP1_003512 [Malassezia sp. CBS 17886]